MWLDEKMEGEPNQQEWPGWFKLDDEPILTTDVGVWYSYVVLPQPAENWFYSSVSAHRQANRDHGC